MMPAQYWNAKVHYEDFSVDYYFLDTNVFDAMDETHISGHNLCNEQKVGLSASQICGKSGPASPQDCPKGFQGLWAEQKDWMDKQMVGSTADWQFVVTHFPPLLINQLLTGGLHQQLTQTTAGKTRAMTGGMPNQLLTGGLHQQLTQAIAGKTQATTGRMPMWIVMVST